MSQKMVSLFFIGFIFFLNGISVHAIEKLVVKPGSSIWLEGDSTMHRYSSTSTEFSINSTLDMTSHHAPLNSDALFVEILKQKLISHVHLNIPVKTMKSGTKLLDSKMYDAINTKEHPEIVYEIKDYEVLQNTLSSHQFLLNANGNLTVSGKTNEISVPITFDAEKNHAKFRGEKKLLMTDYGIKPPQMFFGALKTDDEVVIHFVIDLEIQ